MKNPNIVGIFILPRTFQQTARFLVSSSCFLIDISFPFHYSDSPLFASPFQSAVLCAIQLYCGPTQAFTQYIKLTKPLKCASKKAFVFFFFFKYVKNVCAAFFECQFSYVCKPAAAAAAKPMDLLPNQM